MSRRFQLEEQKALPAIHANKENLVLIVACLCVVPPRRVKHDYEILMREVLTIIVVAAVEIFLAII